MLRYTYSIWPALFVVTTDCPEHESNVAVVEKSVSTYVVLLTSPVSDPPRTTSENDFTLNTILL